MRSVFWSGLLLALCFPKASLFFLAWIGLVPFLYSIKRAAGIKGALLNGYVLGIVFFAVNLAWLTTLADYVGFWAILGYICLVLFQALYFAASAGIIKIIYNKLPSAAAVLIPAAWIFFEWLRTLTPFGVAAGGLGYSQVPLQALIQIASFSSVYGISFLIVLVNCIVFEAAENEKKVFPALLTISIIFAAVLLYAGSGTGTSHSSSEIKISIIQGNIDQKTKLNPKMVNFSFDRYKSLTRQAAAEKPDIIIWTETAVPAYLMENPYLLEEIKLLAKESNAALLIGAPYYESANNIYNSLLAFSKEGKLVGRYNKQHPVPFGEYLPFRPLLYPLLKNLNFFAWDFSGDPNPQIIRINDLKIGPLICFESTFPGLARQRKKQGAHLLLTITNDAWFADSSALKQHLDMGVMRAVENRSYFIQAANTGISAVIDPYGRVLARTKINSPEILTFKIPLP